MHSAVDESTVGSTRARRGTADMGTTREGGRLLIVDDDASLTAMLALHLVDRGYEVTRADCYTRARQLFKPGAFDAALLDYRLPDGSGLELALELRAADPRIRLILMSGSTENGLARRVARCGIQSFLGKPFPTCELDVALGDRWPAPRL